MQRKIRNILLASAAVGAGVLTPAASARVALEPTGEPAVPTTTVQAAQPAVGFQWGDAAIGAGGAVMLVGAAAAGTVAVRRRAVHA